MRIPKLFIAVIISLAVLSTQRTLALSQDPNAAAWKQLAEDGKNVNFPVERITKFGDDIVVNCDGFKSVNFDNLTLKPLIIPHVASLRSVCEDDSKHNSYAFGKDAHGLVIRKKDLEGWHDIKVPPAIMAEPDNWHMVAGGGDLAFVTAGESAYLHNGEWSVAKIDPASVTGAANNPLILSRGKIYSGFNYGEWGGRMYEIDAISGVSKQIFKNSMYPVKSIKTAPGGQIWFVCGVNHMGFETAALYSYDGTVHAHSHFQGMKNYSPDKNSVEPPLKDLLNWNLGATGFRELMFTKDGSLLVTTVDYGVMKYANEKWSRVTPNFHAAGLCGLEETASGLIVLPCWHAGIILVDPKNENYKFILSSK